ncbi:hypothetical protein FH972_023882 [Carpinus fangiana]|uniref:Uncharacterized protein n=1 Tax=Carpinus fangiana TaxID=176857 RepID=A0A5N6KX40_9ROSI|nr:hypothetical protein FH972_023882 [Carpinus fangiana]
MDSATFFHGMRSLQSGCPGRRKSRTTSSKSAILNHVQGHEQGWLDGFVSAVEWLIWVGLTNQLPDGLDWEFVSRLYCRSKRCGKCCLVNVHCQSQDLGRDSHHSKDNSKSQNRWIKRKGKANKNTTAKKGNESDHPRRKTIAGQNRTQNRDRPPVSLKRRLQQQNEEGSGKAIFLEGILGRRTMSATSERIKTWLHLYSLIEYAGSRQGRCDWPQHPVANSNTSAARDEAACLPWQDKDCPTGVAPVGKQWTGESSTSNVPHVSQSACHIFHVSMICGWQIIESR